MKIINAKTIAATLLTLSTLTTGAAKKDKAETDFTPTVIVRQAAKLMPASFMQTTTI